MFFSFNSEVYVYTYMHFQLLSFTVLCAVIWCFAVTLLMICGYCYCCWCFPFSCQIHVLISSCVCVCALLYIDFLWKMAWTYLYSQGLDFILHFKKTTNKSIDIDMGKINPNWNRICIRAQYNTLCMRVAVCECVRICVCVGVVHHCCLTLSLIDWCHVTRHIVWYVLMWCKSQCDYRSRLACG